ncbi:MAG: cyclase family protein [Actinomycetota bacterium]
MCLVGTTETVRERARHDRGVPDAPQLSRRGFLAGGAALALTSLLPGPAAASKVPTNRTRDLTHVFREGFPMYVGDPPDRETATTIPANGFYGQRWSFGEHSGTHMDAPGHFSLGGRLSPAITPEELIVPAVVIDVSERTASDPDTEVTMDDLRRFERRHGRIPRGAGVFMYSGWESRVGDPDAYRNADAGGVYHFPGFDVEAVDWLLENRDIRCIGVDTLSLDNGPSTTFAVHHLLLGADRYGLENLANLSTIPPRGATAFVGLIPWEEGSGGPCRVIARS